MLTACSHLSAWVGINLRYELARDLYQLRSKSHFQKNPGKGQCEICQYARRAQEETVGKLISRTDNHQFSGPTFPQAIILNDRTCRARQTTSVWYANVLILTYGGSKKKAKQAM